MRVAALISCSGWTTVEGVQRPFFWQTGRGVIDLGFGSLPGTAHAVNHRREIVGVVTTPDGRTHACFWER
jgi:hypothetical protein